VCPAVKPVGEPDAGDRHVRFDERGWETGRCRMAEVTAPILDSTITDLALCPLCGRYGVQSGRSHTEVPAARAVSACYRFLRLSID
jgi:hypothetical protein